ncbi:hypothetical protein HNQ94_000292 [Salirhabdus euzebyi]|uniref:YitT family protein n=1 Tax=Salirhabdus euzebyi TaxID=394506 RepID=A0A841PY98_9BACI|nr:YitT family protein [Salirhabdus euzebyi]MBB6451871.1 hypothetical protein [Salirhabdus euzebyi]
MTEKQKDITKSRHLLLRWGFYIIGIIILAFGISLTITAKDLGISPWDVLHYGLYKQFGLTIGSWSIIVGVIIVAFSCIALRQWPKIGTILNMVLIGIFIDLFLLILPDPGPIWMDIIVLISGVIIFAYGIGLYVAANLGAGPRDSLMLYITEKTGWKVQWVRNCLDVIVLLIGWLLGGPVGVGTVIASLTLGTILGYTFPHSKKLMDFMIKRGKKGEDFYKGQIRINHHDCASEKLRR